MRTAAKVLVVILLCVGFIHTPRCSWADRDKLVSRLEECTEVIEDFINMPEQEKGLPTDLLNSCEAIAIFPSVLKGGFIVGGSFGKGVIICRNKETGQFGPPCFFTIGGGSFGLQIGAQAIDLILVVTNQKGVDGLLSSNFTLGGDAAVAAGPVGRNTQVGTDLKMKAAIVSYSRTRGVFAGISLKGAIISPNNKEIADFYGKDMEARQILLSGTVPIPVEAQSLIDLLSDYGTGTMEGAMVATMPVEAAVEE